MADVVVDGLDDATNVNLENHVPDGVGTGWAVVENTSGNPLQILASAHCLRVIATTASSRVIYKSLPDPVSPEYDVEFSIPASTTMPTGTDDPVFMIARCLDANNYYSAGTYQTAAGGAVRIFKKVAGTVTQLATGTNAIAVGDVLTFKVRNASKSLWINGVQVLSTGDNSLTAAGSAGLGTGNAWVSTDDVQGGWRWDDYSVFEYPLPVAGTVELVAQGQGTASAVSSAFTPVAGSVLLVVGAARRQSVDPTASTISHTGTALTWTQTNSRPNGLTTTHTHARVWVALVPATVSPTVITTASASSDTTGVAVFQVDAGTINVLQTISAAFAEEIGQVDFASNPLDTSLVVAIDVFAGTADLGVTGNFAMAAELDLTNGSGANHLGIDVAWVTGRTATNILFSGGISGGTAGAGIVIAIELDLAPGTPTTPDSGTGELGISPTMFMVGGKHADGMGELVVAASLLPPAVAVFNDVDLVAYIQLGGFGGRFFVPAVELPTYRGEASNVNYYVSIGMTPSSIWLVTQDVRAITIDRRLAIYPDEMEAGTCDVVLDDASAVYSPLQPIVHHLGLRPNLPVNVMATYAPRADNIVRSYWLFRGLIDSIDVNPSIDERTVNIRCRDSWKVLNETQISTSMMIDYNVGSVISEIFSAASIALAARSIDTTADAVPYASYLRTPLNDALGDFIDGGGYAAYVAADGVFRVRNRYFDIGGDPASSYWQQTGLNYSLTDDQLVNRLSVVGRPRYWVQSRQIVGKLDQMVQVAASASTEFWIDFFDPRNNRDAGARNGVQPLTSSGDWFLNVSSAGGTNISATASLTVTFYGDGAKVRLWNGNAQPGFLTKFQVAGEPILESTDVSVQYEVASSQLTYGIRDEKIASRLFTTQALINQRAIDIIDQFSDPRPVMRLSAVDDFPGAFLIDLGKVVSVKNEHLGVDADQFTIYGLTHEIRADDVGPVHQVTLDLRLARPPVDMFILDTSHLDIDRLGR